MVHNKKIEAVRTWLVTVLTNRVHLVEVPPNLVNATNFGKRPKSKKKGLIYLKRTIVIGRSRSFIGLIKIVESRPAEEVVFLTFYRHLTAI